MVVMLGFQECTQPRTIVLVGVLHTPSHESLPQRTIYTGLPLPACFFLSIVPHLSCFSCLLVCLFPQAAAAAALIKWVGKERKRNWFFDFLRIVWPTDEAVRMSNLGWESGA